METLGVMRWQPRRCAGMTTVFWAHLAAIERGAVEVGEGRRDLTAPVLRRHGRRLATNRDAKEVTAGGQLRHVQRKQNACGRVVTPSQINWA